MRSGFRANLFTYDPGLRQGWHHHDYFSLTVVLRGGFCEAARLPSGRQDRNAAGPGFVIIKPEGTSHEVAFAPDPTRTFSLHLDSDFSAELPRSTLPNIRRYRVLGPGPVAAAMLGICAARTRTPTLQGITDLALTDLLGALTQELRPSRRDLGIAKCAAERLRDTVIDPPSSTQLATELGVHPVYLARAFRAAHGCSMSQFVHRVRASLAAGLLLRGTPALRVAHDLGFADAAHFSRAFKACMGVGPRRFASLCRAASSK